MPIMSGNPAKPHALASRTVEEAAVVFVGDGLRLELSPARWEALGSPNEVTITKLS